jgi:hypothetical protein
MVALLVLLVLIGVLYVWPIFVAHSIGKRKNREGWLWGFCLGWIGVLIIALRQPRSARVRAQGPAPARGLKPAWERIPDSYRIRTTKQLIATAEWDASLGKPAAPGTLELAIDKAVVARDEPALWAIAEAADRLADTGPAFLNRHSMFTAAGARATLEAKRLETTPTAESSAADQSQPHAGNSTNGNDADVESPASDTAVAGATPPVSFPVGTPPGTKHTPPDAAWYKAQLQRATERYVEGAIVADQFGRILDDLDRVRGTLGISLESTSAAPNN